MNSKKEIKYTFGVGADLNKKGNIVNVRNISKNKLSAKDRIKMILTKSTIIGKILYFPSEYFRKVK